jgi:acyl-CoA synthetase (AMP-forming)/AMP-acid ligase II
MSQHEAVQESAAIGVADEKWGERPLMIVTLKPRFKDKVSANDLKQFMKKWAEEGKLPSYGVPDRYEFIDQIPKTSVGKLDAMNLSIRSRKPVWASWTKRSCEKCIQHERNRTPHMEAGEIFD